MVKAKSSVVLMSLENMRQSSCSRMERWGSRERGYYNYFAKLHPKMTDGGAWDRVLFEGEFFETVGEEARRGCLGSRVIRCRQSFKKVTGERLKSEQNVVPWW